MTPPTGIPALEALLALHEKSTPGEWCVRTYEPSAQLQVVSGGNPPDAGVAECGLDLGPEWPATNNAAFIVAAHNALPALAAECRRLVEENERYRAAYEREQRTHRILKECGYELDALRAASSAKMGNKVKR